MPLQPLISGLFAALVAVGTTLAIERWGGRVGGLIGTMPSTVVPFSIGLAMTSTPEGLSLAMFAVPPGMLLSALFLYLWRVVPPRLPDGSLAARLAMASVISVSLWCCGAVVVVLLLQALGGDLFTTGLVGLGMLTVIVIVGAIACRDGVAAPAASKRVPKRVLLARGTLAGCAIAAAVLVGKLGHPLAAGVASVFPAIFLTTMVALWFSQGEAVQAGAVGPMMLGSSAVASYALMAAFLIPALGISLGAVVAWFTAVMTTTIPAWWWLSRGRHARGR